MCLGERESGFGWRNIDRPYEEGNSVNVHVSKCTEMNVYRVEYRS